MGIIIIIRCNARSCPAIWITVKCCYPLKFIYSEKATKFCEIVPLLLTTVHTVKSKGKISQNFVAFSEYMNFNMTLKAKKRRKIPYVYFFLVKKSPPSMEFICIQTSYCNLFTVSAKKSAETAEWIQKKYVSIALSWTVQYYSINGKWI